MLFLKAFMGAVIVVLFSLVAESKRFSYLAGIIPLFPTFALIGQAFVYHQQGAQAVKKVALFGILSLILYLAFLLGIYFLTDKIGYLKACAVSIGFWFLFVFPMAVWA